MDRTWTQTTKTLSTAEQAPARAPPSRGDTYVEVEAGLGVGVKDSADALGGPDGDGALLCDDLVAIGHLDDPPGASLDELEVGGATLPHPIGLCGRVHLDWMDSFTRVRCGSVHRRSNS